MNILTLNDYKFKWTKWRLELVKVNLHEILSEEHRGLKNREFVPYIWDQSLLSSYFEWYYRLVKDDLIIKNVTHFFMLETNDYDRKMLSKMLSSMQFKSWHRNESKLSIHLCDLENILGSPTEETIRAFAKWSLLYLKFMDGNKDESFEIHTLVLSIHVEETNCEGDFLLSVHFEPNFLKACDQASNNVNHV